MSGQVRQRHTKATSSEPSLDAVQDNEEKQEQSLIPFRIEAALWIVLALSVLYFTDLIFVVLYDERVERSYLHMGLLCGAIFISVGIYFVVYLSYFKKIPTEQWDAHAPPYLIPLAVIFGVLASIFFMIALWTVYGVFSPFILFALFLGFIMSMHFIG